PGGDHMPLVVHRHGERLASKVGGTVEVLLPEQGAVTVELRHREVQVTPIIDVAGGDNVPLVVHGHGERQVITVVGAVDVSLPKQPAVAVELCYREVVEGTGIRG